MGKLEWKIENGLSIKLGVITFENLTITTEKTAFQHLIQCAEKYNQQYSQTPISQIKGVQNARDYFRAIKLDPTKRRPSSEALLNRAIKGKELYAINTLVDTGNWCSLDFLLPICVYDADKIKGNVAFRMGRENESYFGHNNNEVHLHNRYCVADDLGPFGSPITDSKRTAVTVKTTRAVLLIFAPFHFIDKDLQTKCNTFSSRTIEFCDGSLTEQLIIKGQTND